MVKRLVVLKMAFFVGHFPASMALLGAVGDGQFWAEASPLTSGSC